MHPAVASGLIDLEGEMAGAEAGMSTFVDVFLGASKTIDQEISKTLLGALKVIARIHGAQNIIVRDLAIKGGDQARETFFSDDRINVSFFHRMQCQFSILQIAPVSRCRSVLAWMAQWICECSGDFREN